MKTALLVFLLSASTCFANFANAATYEEAKKAADVTVTKNHKTAIQDPTYPKFHLRAPSGWINDPCGLFYYNSSFHVFCQSNPWGSQWGNMTWSHMVSVPDQKFNYKWMYPKYKDGTFETSALIPSLNVNAPDHDGIFTGCAEVLPYKIKDKAGKEYTTYYPTIFYSGVWGVGEDKQEVICIARALDADKVDEKGNTIDPYLTNWTKYSDIDKDDSDNQPSVVIPQPKDLNLISFRDPYHVKLADENKFYICVSGGIKTESGNPDGVFLLFENDGNDITKGWKRVNNGANYFFRIKTAVKDPVTRGGDIECGAVYRLTDHIGTTNDTPYIAIFGQDGPGSEPYGKSLYYVLGNIEKTEDSIKFVALDNFKDSDGNPAKRHLDLNPDFILYASNTMHIDNEQRNYVYGWMNIASQANDVKDYEWAGALSSPRFLFAVKNNNVWELGQEPVLINSLRSKSTFEGTLKLDNSKDTVVPDTEGRFINISSVFNGDNLESKTFGVKVACCDDKCTDIKISSGNLFFNDKKIADLSIPESAAKFGVNIYLDGSVLEVFFSRYVDDTPIGYETYSAPLPNNGSLTDNQVKVYGDSEVTADVQAYEMDSCWAE